MYLRVFFWFSGSGEFDSLAFSKVRKVMRITTLERVSLDVGFYYMANAAGRLLGTLLSGVSFQVGGLSSCLIVSAIFLFLPIGDESILSRLDSYKSYEDCLKEIFLTKKKKNFKDLNVATNWRTPVPCSNLDKTCNRIVEWGNYPKISNSYKPEIIIFNEKDEYNEFVKINKKYIDNDYKKGTDKLNYFQENCGEIDILVRDN